MLLFYCVLEVELSSLDELESSHCLLVNDSDDRKEDESTVVNGMMGSGSNLEHSESELVSAKFANMSLEDKMCKPDFHAKKSTVSSQSSAASSTVSSCVSNETLSVLTSPCASPAVQSDSPPQCSSTDAVRPHQSADPQKPTSSRSRKKRNRTAKKNATTPSSGDTAD